MILIGQYDSPFVRRVAVALRFYGLAYEHLPWSVWRDSEELSKKNPLRRVPTLVLDDGELLVESSAILDALDEMVGEQRALLARRGSLRRAGLRVCAVATGVADKAVSAFYEPLLHSQPSAQWLERCTHQIRDALAWLESERSANTAEFWFGAAISHADIALTCALRFVSEAHPTLLEQQRLPALRALAARCEALPEFSAVVQPLTVALSK